MKLTSVQDGLSSIFNQIYIKNNENQNIDSASEKYIQGISEIVK